MMPNMGGTSTPNRATMSPLPGPGGQTYNPYMEANG
jgi:hypothetical protein